MNFDGKALVLFNRGNFFVSVNDRCFAQDSIPMTITGEKAPLSYVLTRDNSGKIQDYDYKSSTLVTQGTGYIATKVKVYNNFTEYKQVNLPSVSINVIDRYNTECESYVEKPKTVSVQYIEPCNIFPAQATVWSMLDKTETIKKDISFGSVSVKVADKSQVTIPDATTTQGFSIVLQKNNFTEIQFAALPVSIAGIPDGMTWSGMSIKGTVEKSGTYTLTVTYQDKTEQIIDIIVPYYQRLL